LLDLDLILFENHIKSSILDWFFHLGGNWTHTLEEITIPNESESNWDFPSGDSPSSLVVGIFLTINNFGARRE
jgi:hypothetical protein